MKLLQSKPQRKLWIPIALFSALVGALVFLLIRGYWSPSISDPTRSSEGVLCAYQDLVEEGKPIRCVFVVDKPMAMVKAVMTDYDHFFQKFPFLVASQGIPIDKTHTQFVGVATYAVYGLFPFSVLIEHQQTLSTFTASWDQSSSDLAKNRGAWTLRRIDPTHTEVSYSLEIKVKYIPAFILRNILLEQLPQVTEAAKKWIETSPLSSSSQSQ